MKNNGLFLLAFFSLYFTSCIEKFSNVIITGTKQATDTTYIGNTETAQQKNMLVEEFTGASCTQCPSGGKQLENIAKTLDDRMLIVAMHVYNIKDLGGPVHGLSKYDFRTQKGSDLLDIFYPGLNGIPAIGLDRLDNDGKTQMERSKWPGAIDARKTTATPINITLASSYNEQTREAIITVKVAYTKAVEKQQFLSLLIMEDGIVDVQKDGNNIDTFYTFNHVMRDYLTNISGESFLDNVKTKETGRVYQRTFTYKVNEAWKAENCKFVAFVHNNEADSKEVLQASQVNLK